MTHPALLLSASLLVLPFAARAQAPPAAPPPSSPPVPSQLDRIEGKLDELLRRMDQPRPQSSRTVQGTAVAGQAGPGTPPAVSGEAYKPGALAVARAAPRDTNGLAEVPPDSVGGFVHEGGPLAPTCFLQAWLEGRSLDGRSVLVSSPGKQEATASLVLGAELQSGLYRLRVWTACTIPQGVATTSELLLKAPSELNLRPVTGNDLLHREG
jgi:hypothetical protein